jgi:hypothetical protein
MRLPAASDPDDRGDANLAVYAVMLRAGINYLAANVATTALFTVVN